MPNYTKPSIVVFRRRTRGTQSAYIVQNNMENTH